MLWTVSFNFPYIMQMIWYLKCIKLSSIIILTDIYTTSPFEYYQSSVLFLKLISCHHLIYPFVFSLIRQHWYYYEYKHNTPQIQSVDTLQQISMSRGWRLMGSACKWMDHPPPPLSSSPRFAVVRLARPLPSVYHCSGPGQTLLHTTLAKCPQKWQKIQMKHSNKW